VNITEKRHSAEKEIVENSKSADFCNYCANKCYQYPPFLSYFEDGVNIIIQQRLPFWGNCM